MPLHNSMTKPEVAKCPDGHFRRVLYVLGPYIADYPEQVLLTGIVAGWCPKYVGLVLHLRYLMFFRCTAPSSNLDTPSSPPRSQTWTNLMTQNLERKELWDDFGINPDVVVSKSLPQCANIPDNNASRSRMIFQMQIYTNSCLVIFYTKSSRAHSKITWLPGLENIFKTSTGSRRLRK